MATRQDHQRRDGERGVFLLRADDREQHHARSERRARELARHQDDERPFRARELGPENGEQLLAEQHDGGGSGKGDEQREAERLDQRLAQRLPVLARPRLGEVGHGDLMGDLNREAHEQSELEA